MSAGRRSRLRIQLVVVACAAAVAALGAVAWSRALAGDDPERIVLADPRSTDDLLPPVVSNPDMEGDAFPVVDLVGSDGESVTLELDGAPMVVNFWFSSCPPCARELPFFAQVADEYEGRVRFVGVNPDDSADRMREFAADRGVDYELLRDPDGDLVNALGLVGFPTTIFVSADGTIVATTGPIDDDQLRARVEDLL